MPETPLQHTLDHVRCPACEALQPDRRLGQLAALPFAAAAQEWLAWLSSGRRRRPVSASSLRLYRAYIAELGRFFGALPLEDIHLGHVVAYQEQRQASVRSSRRHRARLGPGATPQPSDGASRINHELSCLGQILGRAGLWTRIKRLYEPLPLPHPEALVLSPEEEEHLFQVARTRSRWFVAYCCALISRSTTAGPGEIRHLRLCDIDLGGEQGSFIHIEEGVKNGFRRRPLPLNSDARWAIEGLLERAGEMGSALPHHYLLPHRAHRQGAAPDPSRPMGTWKRAHYAMCQEAAKQFPRLARLRLYDYRHTAGTDLLEDPAVSFTTIEHMLGHRLTSNTKRKYDHLRNSALRVAADALDRKHVQSSSALPAPRRARSR